MTEICIPMGQEILDFTIAALALGWTLIQHWQHKKSTKNIEIIANRTLSTEQKKELV